MTFVAIGALRVNSVVTHSLKIQRLGYEAFNADF